MQTEKKIDDNIIEELAKKLETVTLANVNCRGPKEKESCRFVWCDSMDHMRRDCASLRDVIRKHIVCMDVNMIRSSETRRPLRVNFRRRVTKKAMEDAEATHVDAMHYAASARTRVGKDKIEAARAGEKFWSFILEYEKKGKFTSNEVELVDRSAQSITKWSDPVDDNTIHTEVMCDNHEVLVDEKRKRMEGQDNPSKDMKQGARKRRKMQKRVELYKRRKETQARKGSRASESKK